MSSYRRMTRDEIIAKLKGRSGAALEGVSGHASHFS